MGTLYLVRHGQASFGADDYDQLSPLGLQQAQRLGAHWLAHGQRFDTVLMGTLRRHAQTLDGIAFNIDRELWPNPTVGWVEVAYKLDVNEFRGNQSVQLLIAHLAPR